MAMQKGSKIINGKVVAPENIFKVLKEVRDEVENNLEKEKLLKTVKYPELNGTVYLKQNEALYPWTVEATIFFHSIASIDLTKMLSIDERQNTLTKLISQAIIIDKLIRGEK